MFTVWLQQVFNVVRDKAAVSWADRPCGPVRMWLRGVRTYRGLEPSALSLEMDRPCGPSDEWVRVVRPYGGF